MSCLALFCQQQVKVRPRFPYLKKKKKRKKKTNHLTVKKAFLNNQANSSILQLMVQTDCCSCYKEHYCLVFPQFMWVIQTVPFQFTFNSTAGGASQNQIKASFSVYLKSQKIMLSFPAAEHKLQSAASERRREYYEEQSNEYENHLEESRNGKMCLLLYQFGSNA